MKLDIGKLDLQYLFCWFFNQNNSWKNIYYCYNKIHRVIFRNIFDRHKNKENYYIVISNNINKYKSYQYEENGEKIFAMLIEGISVNDHREITARSYVL